MSKEEGYTGKGCARERESRGYCKGTVGCTGIKTMCTADGADRLVCGKKRNGASTGVPGFRLRHR